MKLPAGFKAAGMSAGIKASGKPDLGLVVSEKPMSWALVSTQNQLKAPCVSRNKGRYSSSKKVSAIVVNSGNANCANGEKGIWDNEDLAGLAAGALSFKTPHDVLTASTGIIGKPLDIKPFRKSLPKIVDMLEADSKDFAEAIITTDTHIKQVSVKLRGGARIVGVAKGSGMIHPNMATMLAFIFSDANIDQEELREVWPAIVDKSFNSITVDGDTSPNDMAFVFANAAKRADRTEFKEKLEYVAIELAKKIVRDGEGATKLITVNILNARSQEGATKAARAVAKSPLVKTAAHGADPNWGRILSAVGYSGAVSDMGNIKISLQTVLVYSGKPIEYDTELVSESMQVNDVVIDIDLGAGDISATAWGCDLSAEYVRINADYTT